jgi:two-component system, chemotaxis family, sensor kinase CheA
VCGPTPSAQHPRQAPSATGQPDGEFLRVIFTPSPELLARGVKVDTIRAQLAQVGRIESVTPNVSKGGISFEFLVTGIGADALSTWRDKGISIETVAATAAPPLATSDASSSSPARPTDIPTQSTNFVRVDLGRLDDLMRLIGDLVVSRARLENALVRVERHVPPPEWRVLQEASESIERQLRDLREGVMRVRLVSVSEIFRRMPFVVRDLARDAGKRVRIELVGQSTEIDKLLIERMMDPVLHLVRNAVSHGIESPDDRILAGKRPEGTIRLSASTLGEFVVLEISDDGRGMDLEAIVARARQSGVPVPDGELDSRALLDLICLPGFSTRDEADRASGRGIGMAVVRNSIQELGGSLSVSTGAAGTIFKAVLPLTLAITDALIVHVGQRTFAVPQSAVQEVAEVESAAVRAIENNELIVHRGAALPVVRLSRMFGIRSSERSRSHVIVIGAGVGAVGILVDRISGQREIVVKTLHDPLVKVAGVSGATELGDGCLVLVLDAAGLTRTIRHRGTTIGAAV